MSNTPSETEIDNLLCKHWPAYSMQAVLVKMWLREAIKSAIAKWGSPQPVVREPQCWCLTCGPMRVDDPESIRMALCPTCGNKRCPKANNHRNQCSNSNEPGQKGSAYEGCGIAQKGGSNADT